ncbi:hypothetical protein SZMC14600_16111, partial [Saccharomonospora azurea SZMC 14600]
MLSSSAGSLLERREPATGLLGRGVVVVSTARGLVTAHSAERGRVVAELGRQVLLAATPGQGWPAFAVEGWRGRRRGGRAGVEV